MASRVKGSAGDMPSKASITLVLVTAAVLALLSALDASEEAQLIMGLDVRLMGVFKVVPRCAWPLSFVHIHGDTGLPRPGHQHEAGRRSAKTVRFAAVGQGARKSSSAKLSEDEQWELLGLERGANIHEVRKAFRDASLKGAHPDLGGDPQRFLALKTAYDELLKLKKQEELDASHGRGPENPVEDETRPPSLQSFRQMRQQQRYDQVARNRLRAQLKASQPENRAPGARWPTRDGNLGEVWQGPQSELPWYQMSPEEQQIWRKPKAKMPDEVRKRWSSMSEREKKLWKRELLAESLSMRATVRDSRQALNYNFYDFD